MISTIERGFLTFFLLSVMSFVLFAQPPTDTDPPVVRVIYPQNGSYSSCRDVSVLISITDDTGINSSSILLTCYVDDHPYPDSLANIWVEWDTLYHFLYPTIPIADGDSVYLYLAPVSDLAGNLSDPVGWFYRVDTLPPEIWGISPPPDSVLTSVSPDMSFFVADRGAGVALCSTYVSFGSDTIFLNAPLVAVSDSSIAISLSDFSLAFPGGDTVAVCIHAADSALYCGANTDDTCFIWTVESGGAVAELISPADSDRISCLDTGIVIALFDDDGIFADSLFIVVDSVERYGIGSPAVSWDGETLRFSPILMGWHHYGLIAYDSLLNPLETPLALDILGDTLPPQVVYFSPDTTALLLDISPEIHFVLRDTLGVVYNSATLVSVYLRGINYTFTLDNPALSLGDTLYTLASGALPTLRGGDTLRVCIVGYDSTTICEQNGSNTCFELVVPYTPPTAELISLHDGVSISCDPFDVRILLFDDEGIIPSSIALRVNGSSYTLASPYLELRSDTLIFQPSSVYGSGVLVIVELLSLSDVLGTPIASHSVWSFRVDTEGPRIISHTPPDSGLTTDSHPTIRLRIKDDFSPVVPESLLVSVDGVSYAYPNPVLGWDGSWLSISLPAGFAEVDTARVCLEQAFDMPDTCPPNGCDCPQCFTFFVDSREPFLDPPDMGITACSLQVARMYLFSPLGINPASILFEADGVPYTVDSTGLTYENDTLRLEPSRQWTDGDTVQCLLVHADDGITSLDSIGWSFVVDLSPPVVELLYPIAGAVPRVDPPITFVLTDLVSGVNRTAVAVDVNGSIFGAGSPYLPSSGDTFTIDIASSPLHISGGDTVHWCVSASDIVSPVYCGPNETDTCFDFYIPSEPPSAELIRPDTIGQISCADTFSQRIDILLHTPYGLLSDSVRLVVDGDTFSVTDRELTILEDTLRYVPSVPFVNGDSVFVTLRPLWDTIENRSVVFSFRFVVDTEPPEWHLSTPPPWATVSDTLTGIRVVLDDNFGVFEYRLYIDDAPIRLDSLVDSVGFYSFASPLDSIDTVDVCLWLSDFSVLCGANEDSSCVRFYVDGVPPGALLLSPDDGAIVSCAGESLIVVFSDISGVDPLSVQLLVNGDTLTMGSPGIRFANDTLIYSPSSPYSDGDTVRYELLSVSDFVGNGIIDAISGFFVVDISPPMVVPLNGDTITEPSPILSFIMDDLSGVDTMSIVVSINGTRYTWGLEALSFSSGTLSVWFSDLGLELSAGDTVHICIESADFATGCSVNLGDTCFDYYVPSSAPLVRVLSPHEGWRLSCPDISVRFLVQDDEGIDPMSIVLSHNSIVYDISSPALSLSGDTLIFLPSSAFDEGNHTVCLDSVGDVIGSAITSPVCVSFIIDTTPPFITPLFPVADERISTQSPVIQILLQDDGTALLDSLTVAGSTVRLGESGLTFANDTVILSTELASLAPLPEGDIEVCIFARDSVDSCPPNSLDSCFTFVITLDAPSIVLIEPEAGAVSSCSNQRIIFLIIDDDGIESIRLVIDSDTLTLTSPELSLSGDTLIYIPSHFYSDDSVHFSITATDSIGNGVNPPFVSYFYIDTIPPELVRAYPPADTFIIGQEPTISFLFDDNITAVSLDSLVVQINDTLIMPSHIADSAYIAGLHFPERESVSVDVMGFCDSPDLCASNCGETVHYTFFVGDGDTIPPYFTDFDISSRICGMNVYITCCIADSSGVMSDSVFLLWWSDAETARVAMEPLSGDTFRTIGTVPLNEALHFVVYACDSDYDDENPDDMLCGMSEVQTIECIPPSFELVDFDGDTLVCVGDTAHWNLRLLWRTEAIDMDSVSLFSGDVFTLISFALFHFGEGDTLALAVDFVPDVSSGYGDTVIFYITGGGTASLVLHGTGIDCISEFSALPDPISPQRDGINDALIFEVPTRVEWGYYIYTLTGQLVAHRERITGRTAVWDGICDNGALIPAGTYIFVVETSDGKRYKGTETVVR